MGLQGSRFLKAKQDARPFGSFPSRLGLNEGEIRDQRTKAAQGRSKPQLADLFSKLEAEINLVRKSDAIPFRERILDRQAQNAKDKEEENDEGRADHNSLS
jgi:hypothetical protein